MIELRVLGDATLARADGVEASTVLAQPKRFALLVYLVLAAPRGFQRRDALLLRFWPESDEERARASLRTGLHFLRRALGPDVVESRGADEIRVVAGAVRCDVLEFEAAVTAGRLEEALALYRGPLLPAFGVADAPGWDDWLDAERARLTRLAAGAAWTLADRAEAVGDGAAAARWGRRAVELTPDEEEPVRRLVALLGRTGDRAGALRAYEAFARRLATEFDAAPSPQTREVAERVRAMTETPALPAPVPVGAPSVEPPPVERAPVEPPPVEPPPVAPPARAPVARRSRRWMAAAGLLGMAAVGVLAWGAWRGPPRADVASPVAAEPTTERVAVLPFVVRGYTRHDYLGEGLVELLSATLDGAGELRTVDPRVVLGSVAAAEELLPEEARRAAERLGARYHVHGAVVASEDRLQVTASLYDRFAGAEPVAVARVEGSADDPFRLVDSLTARLIAGRFQAPAQRLDRIAAQTTSSLPALKLYLQGRQALRAGRFDAAVDLFAQALDADSTFALAAYGLSVAGDVAGRGAALDPMPIAMRHAARLPVHDRMLVEARLAGASGHTAEAMALYRRVLAHYPDDVEAWYQLGDLLFHAAAYGDPARLAQAREAFERVLLYESAHEGALQHAARIAAATQDRGAVDSLTRRALAHGATGDIALEMAALRALALDDAAARERLLPQLARTPENRVWLTVWRAAMASENFADAAPLLAPLVALSRPVDVRADGHVGLAHLALAGGRPAAARRELARADALRPGSALAQRVLWAPHPFLDGECERAPGLAALVRDGDIAPRAATIPAAAAYAPIPLDTDGWREYLGGLLAACDGRHDEARRAAAALAADSAVRPLAVAIRAAVAWAEGRGAAAALADSTPAPEGARHRYVRAELLAAAGRTDDALATYRGLHADADHRAAVLAAPALLRGAEILERQRKYDLAIAAYRRAAWIWRDAEPELRPVVDRALRRARELDVRE